MSSQEQSQSANVSLDEALSIVQTMGVEAREAQARLGQATSREKNSLLLAIADALVEQADTIAEANAVDMAAARERGMSQGLLDRLLFTPERIAATASSVRDVASLPDPVGTVERGSYLPNGMRLTQIHVPMGVVGMIYEARPNVTVDVASLCIKSGNAVIVRGGHDAYHTNQATLAVIHSVLEKAGFSPQCVQSVDNLGRMGATAMMKARGYIDVLVPRGGASLIEAVVTQSLVPVIETGTGNCHIYVDESANLEDAVRIVVNAKTQRVGVCNAAEKLLLHSHIAKQCLALLLPEFAKHRVELRLDQRAYDIVQELRNGQSQYANITAILATSEDWDTEYLAMILGVAIVDNVDEAITHINAHSTGHTEAIISENYATIEQFVARIDSSTIMVNASTRFTDGGMFGLGAELGISTQKLHARGPMGLRELTTTKWIAYGTGQIRE